MRAIVAFALLGMLFMGSPAFATEIPKEALDADFKACLQTCTPKNGEAKCTAFCKCTNDGAASQFTYEEYAKLANDLGTGRLADEKSIGKLKAIAANCGKQHLAGTAQ